MGSGFKSLISVLMFKRIKGHEGHEGHGLLLIAAFVFLFV